MVSCEKSNKFHPIPTKQVPTKMDSLEEKDKGITLELRPRTLQTLELGLGLGLELGLG